MSKGIPTTKISVKIFRPIIEQLIRHLDAACLRRDAYLNFLLAVELPALDREVSVANTEASERLVSNRLARLDTKLVSLALHTELVERLNEICQRKRIVRDAFFNRVFLLLSASPAVVDELYFKELADKDWRGAVWQRIAPDNDIRRACFDPLHFVVNPFWSIRAGLDEGCFDQDYFVANLDAWTPSPAEALELPCDGVYTRFFSDELRKGKGKGKVDLVGLNCFVPTKLIELVTAAERPPPKLDELLLGSRRAA